MFVGSQRVFLNRSYNNFIKYTYNNTEMQKKVVKYVKSLHKLLYLYIITHPLYLLQ